MPGIPRNRTIHCRGGCANRLDRANRLRLICILGLIAMLLSPSVRADGGAVLAREEAPPFSVTLFASPQPLRAGPADLSVMVQDLASDQPILDAEVRIAVVPTRGDETGRAAWTPPCCSMKSDADQTNLFATHANAQNKLLYATGASLPESGQYEITVTVTHRGESAAIRSRQNVLPPRPPITAYWAFLILPPLAIGGYALREHIRRG